MFRNRLLSAVIGIPVIIFAVWFGGLFLAILTGLIFLLGLLELLGMFSRHKPISKPLLALFGVGIFLFSTHFLGNIYNLASITVFLVICLLSILFSEPGNSFVGLSITFLSTIYMALINYINLLRNLPNGLTWLLLLLVCIWVNDSAAYLGGKKYGRRSLAPKISPKKTKEGALFGVLGSLAAAWVFVIFVPSLPPVPVLILGVLIAVAGQLGDLVESAIKREAGVKDAGKLIPGHGGILDRFDSMLLGAPLVYYYVSLFIIS